MVDTTSQFDLVLTGQLAQGVERSSAIAQLALLFKMPAEKIANLLASAPVVLKRDLAWEVAKRYRVAIKQAGALSDIRPAESSRVEASGVDTSGVDTSRVDTSGANGQPIYSQSRAAPEVTTPTMAAANNSAPQVSVGKVETAAAAPTWSLAAVGADVLRPDERQTLVSKLADFADFSLRPNEGNLLDTSEMAQTVSAPTHLGGQLDLLPPGTDVLAEHERALPVAALVAPPEYEVANLGERLSQSEPNSAQAPDTSHLSLAKS